MEVDCHYLPTSPRQPPTRLNMQHAISRPGATSRVSIPGPVSREQRGPVFTRVRVTVYKHPTRGRGTVKDTDSAKLFLFFLTICFSRYLQLYIGLVAKVWEPSMLWFCCVNCWRGRGGAGAGQPCLVSPCWDKDNSGLASWCCAVLCCEW